MLPLDQLLPTVQRALGAARTADGWDQTAVRRLVAQEFGFLGAFTEARIVRAEELEGAEAAAARLVATQPDAGLSGSTHGPTAGARNQGISGSGSTEFLVLGFQAPEGRDLLAAERAYQRATAQAERGEVRPALRELARVVRDFPEVGKYHRAAGQAHLVLGDLEQAEDALLRALRLDPQDADALTLLGNLYQRRGRPADAIPLYERSIAVARNVYALTNLGAALAETEQPARALPIFREAVREDGSYPNAWFGLALTITRLQDLSLIREAVDALDQALAAAKERRRAPEVWDNARGLLDSLVVIQAKEEVPVAGALVRATLAEHAAEAGTRDRLPVELTETSREAIGGVLAKLELGWVHGRSHHRLLVGTAAASGASGRSGAGRFGTEPIGPEREHLVLHELEHLALATVARDAGTNRWFVSTAEGRTRALRVTAPDVKRVAKLGYPESAIAGMVEQGIAGLLGQLFNFPVDLLIETRLLERHPEIRDLVFYSVRRQLETGARIAEDTQIRKVTPSVIWRANTAMNAAMALWLETRFPRRTDLAARYQKASADAWTLAKRLYSAWTDAAPTWTPGAEYAWVDRWASILGLQGWYTWQDGNPSAGAPPVGAVVEPSDLAGLTTPSTHAVAHATQGVEAADDAAADAEENADTHESSTSPLRRDEEGAATFYMLGALEWAERVGAAQVAETAREAAMLGMSGIQYHDPEPRYTLASYNPTPLTGLHLLSVMYVCWKQIDPTLDQGINLEAPYRAASALYAMKRQRPASD